MITEPTALLAFMFLVVAFARFLEGRFAVVQKVSSAVVCTLLGILLANIGVIPHDSAVHAGVGTYAVPYAIVLVILSSRLKDLRKAGKPLLIAFALRAPARSWAPSSRASSSRRVSGPRRGSSQEPSPGLFGAAA